MHITPLFLADDQARLDELDRQYARREPNVGPVRLEQLIRADTQGPEPSYLVWFEQGEAACGYLIFGN